MLDPGHPFTRRVTVLDYLLPSRVEEEPDPLRLNAAYRLPSLKPAVGASEPEPEPVALPFLSLNQRRPHQHDTAVDRVKYGQVRAWIPVDNSCVGTCRHCGYRGAVDLPSVGLY